MTFLTAGAVYDVDRGLRRERRRAEGLAARKVARADQLEGLQRIVAPVRWIAAGGGRHAGRSSTTSRRRSTSRWCRRTCPTTPGASSMVGVAGYDSPFHVIETGVGIIGRAAATRDRDLRPRRPRRSRLPRRPVRRPQRGRGARPPRRRAAGDRELRGDRRPSRSRQAHVAVAEMLARSIAAALRSARLDDERRQRLHAIERVLEVSRALAADLDRTRIVAAVVGRRPRTCSARTPWNSSAAAPTARSGSSRSSARPPTGSARSSRRVSALPAPSSRRSERGRLGRRDRPRRPRRCRSASTIRVSADPRRDARARRPSVPGARAADRRPAGDPDRGRAAQRRPARSRERGRRARPADRSAQPALLRRGGRDGLRDAPPGAART